MATMQDWAAVLRRTILVAALVALIAAAVAVPLLEELRPEVASIYRRYAYAIVTLVTIVGLWPLANWQRLLTIPWPLVAALAWCWLSVTWSIAPQVALVRIVLTTMVIWVVFTSVRHLGYARALATIRIVLAIVLLLNYATLLLYPDISMTHTSRYWSDSQWLGMMTHKNHAGALCAFTALLFLFDVDRRWRVPFAGIALAATTFLGFTVSRTAVFCGAAALLAGGLIVARHRTIGIMLQDRRARLLRAGGYGLATLFLAMILYFTVREDAFLSLMADPEALSRRTVIWRQLVQTYVEQPLSGIGFGSYWTGANDLGAAAGQVGWQGKLTQGHNGILDLLVQIGLPGLVLVFLATVVWPIRQIARLIGPLPRPSALMTALLVLCLGSNLAESGLLERDSLWNVLLMLTLALTAALTQQADPRTALWTAAEERHSARSSTRRRRSSSDSQSGRRTRPRRS
jgi:exopolysaccharide production protein ExoQ